MIEEKTQKSDRGQMKEDKRQKERSGESHCVVWLAWQVDLQAARPTTRAHHHCVFAPAAASTELVCARRTQEAACRLPKTDGKQWYTCDLADLDQRRIFEDVVLYLRMAAL